MLVIRFLRTGKRNQPFFRLVVTDKRNPPRGGRFLEILGFFNPLTKEKRVKADRIKYWLGVGAQPSDRVHNLLVAEKIIEAKKKPVHVKKKEKPASAEATMGKKEGEAPAEKSAEKPVEKKEEKKGEK